MRFEKWSWKEESFLFPKNVIIKHLFLLKFVLATNVLLQENPLRVILNSSHGIDPPLVWDQISTFGK